jgi:hypothetical protein
VGGRAVLAVALAGLALSVVPVAAAASGTKGRAGAHAAAPKLAQVGHATFWECPAKKTSCSWRSTL